MKGERMGIPVSLEELKAEAKARGLKLEELKPEDFFGMTFRIALDKAMRYFGDGKIGEIKVDIN